ncbi:hydantoinase/oxoprolinase family protein [Methylobacterium frigidaeris]|uniref:Acetophenone carboxylase gamma subunit n=3 Tax=Methylobacterium frigidaeris TaxID=2038277 RepID=A0AA37M6Z2_9HYPH|nr:hydantoinase/oxoprolinase family protein [Methylobacterium frigidaeris]GJD64314.1 Acetophenone carboxylase gamma subunit [Methylobacterium frigidaeris]
MKTIGVDVGGTFTDLALCDVGNGEVVIHKVATTPHDPSEGVVQGVREVCARAGTEPGEIAYVFHGTTTATNAVLENKLARAGMITNAGFRDILHIGRHQRVEHYSIRQELPWQSRPPIARRHRKTVAGRLVPPTGAELVPLDEAGVGRAAEELKAEGVEAVAICFLFSFLNPAHEERARAIVEAVMPEAFVTTSSSVSPQFREFERFTTAALAAAIGPKVRRYIANLESALARLGVTGELRIMASNGGAATARMVSEKPALTLLSGLAAGVLGGRWVGERMDRHDLITLDIGGTSADISLIREGRFAETDARSTALAGFPLLLPMIDVHTIGAGGGSIAHLDRGGAFRVGPRSAGAVPGPAAYGKGGDAPTVTDAHVVLGHLDPEDFVAGDLRLDPEAAVRVVGDLAGRLGLPLHEAAEGILTVLNANMANAIRSRTVQKGLDPRGFALMAMGGAGPLHGAAVAQMLAIPEVIVPPYPGITSALGLLTTDLKYDAIRTQFQVSDSLDIARLTEGFAAMEAELAGLFSADRVPAERVRTTRTGDLRYLGQGYELSIDFPSGALDAAGLDAVWRSFHDRHAAEYGHAFPGSPIEIVNIRVAGTGLLRKLPGLAAPAGGSLDAAELRRGRCLFRIGGRLTPCDTPFYRREALPVGAAVAGPAIIVQQDSTTLVPPGARAGVHPSGSLVITLGDAA